jgi:hypothetical protein
MATPEPGETRPRHLPEPPGRRYEAAAAAAPSATQASRPRAILFGGLAAFVAAIAWLLVAGILGLDYGAVVVAILLGWLVGSGAAYGAWSGGAHEADTGIRTIAVALALAGWGLGVFLDYLWSQLTIPESQQTLPERLAAEPFPAWVGGQLNPLFILSAIAVGLFAWRAAR